MRGHVIFKVIGLDYLKIHVIAGNCYIQCLNKTEVPLFKTVGWFYGSRDCVPLRLKVQIVVFVYLCWNAYLHWYEGQKLPCAVELITVCNIHRMGGLH